MTVRDVYTTPTAIRRILPQAGEQTASVATAASAVAAAQRAALEALVGLGSGTGAAA